MRPQPYSSIILEGSQGAGKTTAATYLAQILEANLQRGIPQSELLKINSEPQNWQESYAVLVQDQAEGITIFDRSLVSLIAYNMRTRPNYRELVYRLGASFLQRAVASTPHCFVFLEATPEECLMRQNMNTVCALGNLDVIKEEIRIYSEIAERLRGGRIKYTRNI